MEFFPIYTIGKIRKYNIKSLIVQSDVSSRQSVIKALNEIKKHFKKIDVLVLMASVFEKMD